MGRWALSPLDHAMPLPQNCNLTTGKIQKVIPATSRACARVKEPICTWTWPLTTGPLCLVTWDLLSLYKAGGE